MAEKFRKKPVVIEAVRFDGSNFDEIADFVMENGSQDVSGQMAGDIHLVIHTLEGDMRANVGDWIIRGVQNEFYPCAADIFEQTYERVEG